VVLRSYCRICLNRLVFHILGKLFVFVLFHLCRLGWFRLFVLCLRPFFRLWLRLLQCFPLGHRQCIAPLFVPVIFADVFVASGASVEVSFSFVLGEFECLFVLLMPFWCHALESFAHGVCASLKCVVSATPR
jgi:hypothetical protein